MADVKEEVMSEMKEFKTKTKDISKEIFKSDEPIIEKKPRVYTWQKYLSQCLAKVDPNQDDSAFAAELVSGEKANNVNEVMQICGKLYRNTYKKEDDPTAAFKEDLIRKKEKRDGYTT